MTATYTALANITVTGTPSSITFGSIPNDTYTDLVLVMETVTSTAATKLLRINNDSGANYDFARISGNGSSTSAGGNNNGTSALAATSVGDVSTERLFTKVSIGSYRTASIHRYGIIENGRAGSGVDLGGFRWRNTAVISSLVVTLSTGTFTAGSTLALYGIVS